MIGYSRVVSVALSSALLASAFVLPASAVELPCTTGSIEVGAHTKEAGQKFTAYRIDGIDLTADQGWKDAKNLSTARAAKNLIEPGVSAETNQWGFARFNDLPVGAYLLRSEQTRDFIVTVPMEEKGGLNCEVVVRPKDQPSGNVEIPRIDTQVPPKRPQVNTHKPSPRSWLPNTGASVLGIVAVAAVLIAVGVLLVRRRK